ncbi:hypothetical protein [Spirosoma sp.]|uniref:hypothetical protein n=1 Tax=Spirosoma sp. TaxID=1899569 RepID=UPI003B3B178A
MKRPKNEPNTIARVDGHYYTRLCILTPQQRRKYVFYFIDKNEDGGLFRYEAPQTDWYIFTAVEKLDKLPVEEQQNINHEFVFGLWHAIRQRHQREISALAYDLPVCRHTRSAVEKWMKRVSEKYGDLKLP